MAEDKIEKTDDEWRGVLTPEQFHVLREHGTERAGTSPLNHEKRPGTFICAACEQALFDAGTKFESGTGWPSFWDPLEGAVGTTEDRSFFMTRVEVHCANCGGHLGHVFPDGRPRRQRDDREQAGGGERRRAEQGHRDAADRAEATEVDLRAADALAHALHPRPQRLDPEAEERADPARPGDSAPGRRRRRSPSRP